MVKSIDEARALLEREGWTFDVCSRLNADGLGSIVLRSTHSILGITSETIAVNVRQAWELLVASGGP